MYVIRRRGDLIFAKYEIDRAPNDGEEAVSLETFESITVPCILSFGPDGEAVVIPADAPVTEGTPVPAPEPVPVEPTEVERLRADVDYLAALGGVVL